MAIFHIPTDFDAPAFRITTTLDGITFDLRFALNGRDGFYRMDIGRNGVPLVTGIKVVLTTDILRAHKSITGLPAGILFVVDKTDTNTEPNKDNFGDSVVLAYEDVA